ncbi:unnamed protein product [Adineta ricciae]|uniref:Uncharacterized protein n=1 Tax=Adineta ricciae TaxID=249248 RepID=A0A814LDE4_ADIRI|nr:unnamed protein product [Adineta ricciae]CAF1115630.1 unnamed protein product [Adineta ricciae]
MPLSQRKLTIIFGILATVTVAVVILLIPVYMRSRRNNIPSETTLSATTSTSTSTAEATTSTSTSIAEAATSTSTSTSTSTAEATTSTSTSIAEAATSTSTAEATTDPNLTMFNKITTANGISSLANLLTTKLVTRKSTSAPVGTTNPLNTRLASSIDPTTAASEALTTDETTPTIEEIYSNNTVPIDQASVVTDSNEDLRETTAAIDREASEMSTRFYTSEIPSNESSMMIDTTAHHLNLTNISEAVSFGTITMTSITKVHETSTDTSNTSAQILRTIPTNTTLNVETSIPVTSDAKKTIITTSQRMSLANKSMNSTEIFSLKQRTSILTTAILAAQWSTILTSTTETRLSTANINSTSF